MRDTDREMRAGTGDWWRGATIYESCVRSFRDSNGDGEGDLDGLIAGRDCLAVLGVDAIWLMRVSPSPNFASGDDLADDDGIEPAFGTVKTLRSRVDAAHARGLRVVIDQNCSHSSHLHPWFIASASSRDNPEADWPEADWPEADWYVWADPRLDGGPPNNWLGWFGGHAREWNAARRQDYLDNFLIEQPDLNLHNPEVQDEILAITRHLFALGVDGLRLDVVNFDMHDPALRDNPPAGLNAAATNPYDLQSQVHDRSGPGNLPFLARMCAKADRAGNRPLPGEISCNRQEADPGSMLRQTRARLQLRREAPALRLGAFDVVEASGSHLVFRRSLEGASFGCGFNSGAEAIRLGAAATCLAGDATDGILPPDGFAILSEGT